MSHTPSSAAASAASAAAASSSSAAAAGDKRKAAQAQLDDEQAKKRGSQRQLHAGPQKPRAELYRDVLQLVFEFLSLEELAQTAARCSKDWLAAAASMEPLEEELELPLSEFPSNLTSLLRSSLRRHVDSLRLPITLLPIPPDSELCLSPSALQLLQQHLSHLWELTCSFDVSEFASVDSILFPSSLTSLTVDLWVLGYDIRVEPEDWDNCGHAVGMISHCTSLVELNLGFPRPQTCEYTRDSEEEEEEDIYDEDPEPDPCVLALQPLTQLSQLESLTLRWGNVHYVMELSAEQIHLLRSFPELTYLRVPHSCWNAEELRLLAAEPPPPKLQHLVLSNTLLRANHAEAIAGLRSFTVLDISLGLRDASFLAHLPQLTNVTLNCLRQVDIPLLLAALQQCKRIQILELAHPRITEAHLTELLPKLPELESLYLVDLPELRSLSFLPLLADTLCLLDLRLLLNLPQLELKHIFALRSLRTLHLGERLTSDLSPQALSQFTPGSASAQRLLPSLQEFERVTEPQFE